jgi:ATP-dependent Clp protease ATP-binding subunit ClpA
MLERFVGEARAVATQAQQEARALGSRSVEAEHLLLALAGESGSAARDVLHDAGLDPDAVRAALDVDFAASLAYAGVELERFALPEPAMARREPRWGASAKAALAGALEVARARGDRRISPGHILLAVLHAEEGTVPRALRRAGPDPYVLIRAMDEALG